MIRMGKGILIVAGSICLCLGIIGIILPLLPTTPFLLLSAYCYGKSSERLHSWLLNNRIFGEYIKQFKNGQGVPLRVRITIIFMIWMSMVYSLFFIPFLIVKILFIILGISISAFLLLHSMFKPTIKKS